MGKPIVESQPADPSPREAAGTLASARDGDLAAFRELLRAHKARVFSLALRLTGQHADAEELAQDVFLQMHGALAQMESEAHLKHWLLRTVSHRAIDRLRRRGRRPQLLPMDAMSEEAEPATQDEAGDPLANARMRQLLLQLAPEARAVVLLRFQEDLDPSDIAVVLAMSVNTVKSHLRRSLEWMRARMAGESHGI